MIDLPPSKWINDEVINCFASMLNYEEKERTSGSNIFGHGDKIKGTKSLLFSHTNCFVSETVYYNCEYYVKVYVTDYSNIHWLLLFVRSGRGYPMEWEARRFWTS
ncbi:hypothetical protein Hanom_Chr12g01086691 [Helianthus anomalus]